MYCPRELPYGDKFSTTLGMRALWAIYFFLSAEIKYVNNVDIALQSHDLARISTAKISSPRYGTLNISLRVHTALTEVSLRASLAGGLYDLLHPHDGGVHGEHALLQRIVEEHLIHILTGQSVEWTCILQNSHRQVGESEEGGGGGRGGGRGRGGGGGKEEVLSNI